MGLYYEGGRNAFEVNFVASLKPLVFTECLLP